MKKCLNFAAAIFILSLCSAPLWAQVQGTIKGVAKDDKGKPIAGATVQLVDSQSGQKTETKTNAKGEYFSDVTKGNYNVTLIQNGTAVLEFKSVSVTPDKETVVDFDLAKSKPGMTEEERQKAETAQKQHEKIKGLNASLNQARELEGAGNFDQAISVLQQATQADPSKDLIWANLGEAQRMAGEHATDPAVKHQHFDDAIASFQKALAIVPTSGAYMALLGNGYAKSGQYDKAAQEYSAAAQADPTNATQYYFNLGVVYTNSNKPDDAVAALDKAIQLDPNRADAYYLKGQNLLAKATTKGDKMIAPEGTAEAFNKYLELQPNGRFAESSKQMLAALGANVETTYGKSKGKKK